MDQLKTTPEHYKRYMFMYGILSILHVMEFFEAEENYEECNKIIKAIKDQEKLLNEPLFTTITKDNIKQVIDAYKRLKISAEGVFEMSLFYSTQIIMDIERLSNVRIIFNTHK